MTGLAQGLAQGLAKVLSQGFRFHSNALFYT